MMRMPLPSHSRPFIMLSKYKILLSKLEAGMTNNTTVKVSKRYQIAVPALARESVKY